MGFTADQRLVAEVLLRSTPLDCCLLLLVAAVQVVLKPKLLVLWNDDGWLKPSLLTEERKAFLCLWSHPFCVFGHILSWSGDVQSRIVFVWGTEKTFPVLDAFMPEWGITFLDRVRLKRGLNLDLSRPKLKCYILENCVKTPILLILASCIFPSALSLKSVSWPHDLKRAVSWLWCWCPSGWVLSSSQSILKANLYSALVGNLFSWNLFLHLTPCMLYEILGLLTGLWNLRWISVRICYWKQTNKKPN